ncbi:triose-phosphate isomerase [Candidatus Babeliales bacterium]|nr:triose-phosphate isomerase [Candidatus Babeliales bacterium]MCF7899275.1 triose-phosphate isomerase [Candidatus Babeliales bacterium]
MRKQYLFVANWKMNFNINQEFNFATHNYDDLIKLSEDSNTTIILCPSFLSLYDLNKIFKETKINIGAQDCSPHSKGPYTGQISAESLSFTECKYCIIGHSERREFNKEIDAEIAKKFMQLINHKISPILCIGEKLQEYKENKTLDILKYQLEKIFNVINTEIISQNLPIIIAYEPIWAIGSGSTASIDYLENIFTWLKIQIENLEKKINCKLLYGGSISPDNAKSLKSVKLIDGFLIGKSSLDFQEFKKIVEL